MRRTIATKLQTSLQAWICFRTKGLQWGMRFHLYFPISATSPDPSPISHHLATKRSSKMGAETAGR